MPALLTAQSNAPKRFDRTKTIRFDVIALRDVGWHEEPLAANSLDLTHNRFALLDRRAATTTFAPSRANRSAVAAAQTELPP
jgi:hypothetical protein